MKDLDNFITNIVTKKINEPQEYEMAIRDAFNKKTPKKQRSMRFATAICSVIIISTGVVYATEIRDFIIKNFYNYNSGVDTAIENGFIDEPEMNNSNSDNIDILNGDISNTEIKVKNMLMDDYSLSFTFSLKMDKNININEIKDLRFKKVLISDENNNILHCDLKEPFDRFCSENKLDYEFLNHNENYISNSYNSYITSRNPEMGTIDLVFNLYNNRENPYPKSKELRIQIDEICIFETEAKELEKEKILKINEDISFNINEKFSSREDISYKVIKTNYNDIKVKEASLKETEFFFSFELQTEPFYKETDSEEVKQEKIDEYNKYFGPVKYGGHIAVTDCYIENELGERYDTFGTVVSSPTTIDLEKGILIHKNSFTLTKYNQTDKLKVYFNLNLPNDERNVCIEFEKIY